MSERAAFFTRKRFKTILASIGIELFFILLLQPVVQFLISNNANMDISSLFSVEVTVVLLIGFSLYLCWQFWKWQKEDETLVKNSLISLLHDLHVHQSKLIRYVENDNKEQIGEEITEINSLLKELETHQHGNIAARLRAQKELEHSVQ